MGRRKASFAGLPSSSKPGKVSSVVCGRRFVSRFSVHSTAAGWEGTTGPVRVLHTTVSLCFVSFCVVSFVLFRSVSFHPPHPTLPGTPCPFGPRVNGQTGNTAVV